MIHPVIRSAKTEELEAIRNLAIETIEHTCSHDYSPDQLNAWTAAIRGNTERWEQSIGNQYFLVAEIDQRIVGFASLDQCYVDFMYIHQDFTRKGIAKTLYKRLEIQARSVGCTLLTSHVSKTALPFFEKVGFSIIREKIQAIKGVTISNYQMEKILIE